MRSFTRIASLLLAWAALFSCRPANQAAPKPDELSALIEREIGKDAISTKNKTGSFILCKKEVENASNSMTSVRFIIIRLYDKKIVEEGSVTMGQVEWSGDFEVEVSQAPEQAGLQRNKNTTNRKIDLKRHDPKPR